MEDPLSPSKYRYLRLGKSRMTERLELKITERGGRDLSHRGNGQVRRNTGLRDEVGGEVRKATPGRDERKEEKVSQGMKDASMPAKSPPHHLSNWK